MSNPFSPDALHSALAETLAFVPDGKRGALVAVATEDGAQLMLAAKLGSHWQLAAGGEKPWHAPLTGKVQIVGVW